ncbi:MAG: hypothetical protein ABR573_06670 [Candidatus Dormibacteria bacterium]
MATRAAPPPPRRATRISTGIHHGKLRAGTARPGEEGEANGDGHGDAEGRSEGDADGDPDGDAEGNAGWDAAGEAGVRVGSADGVTGDGYGVPGGADTVGLGQGVVPSSEGLAEVEALALVEALESGEGLPLGDRVPGTGLTVVTPPGLDDGFDVPEGGEEFPVGLGQGLGEVSL